MLPTTGYFKDIECPYFDNSCGRPYCHFRHKKKSSHLNTETPTVNDSMPTYNPTPKSQLANVRTHIPISYVPDVVVRTDRNSRALLNIKSEKLVYNPTPLSILSTVAKSKLADTRQNDKKDDLIDINIEDLSSEFQLLDEILNSSPEEPCYSAENVNSKNVEDIASCDNDEKLKDDNLDSKKHIKEKDETKSHKSKKKHDRDKEKHRKENHHSHNSSKHTSSKSYSSNEKKHVEKSHSKRTSSYKEESDNKKKKESENDRKNKTHSKSKDKKHKLKNDESRRKIKLEHTEGNGKSKSFQENQNKKSDKSRDSVKIKTEVDNKQSAESMDINFISDNEEFDFEDDLEAECYKIFNEYKPSVPKYIPQDIHGKSVTQDTEYIPTKKRVAHENAENQERKVSFKLKSLPNPALVMENRIKLAKSSQGDDEQQNIVNYLKNGLKRISCTEKVDFKRQRSSQVKPQTEVSDKKLSTCNVIDEILSSKTKPTKVYSVNQNSVFETKSSNIKIKPKIAPVQNVLSIQKAKERISKLSQHNQTNSKTIPQTIGKNTKRVAHIPDSSLSDLPNVLQADRSKLPVNVRTRFLTLLADECLKLYLIKEDAYIRALTEELKCYERCSALITYKNSAMLSVNRLRKELQERESAGLGPILSDDITSNDESKSPFKGLEFYTKIYGFILSDEQLEQNGYPRECITPGRALIKSQKTLPTNSLSENERICCRCSKLYLIDEDGFPLEPEDCLYHPLKKRTLRGERTYLCCKSSDDIGCVTSNTHVSEVNEFESTGFQVTMDPESDDDPRSQAVYALDCEMCYTTKGLELTRVTIVDIDCKIVYESLVKPLNPIIDYNTTFSGITKEQMDRTSTNILQVQANVLHLCNSKTILIGHSLESDLKSLKIIHSTVIDTAILFPHKFGLPHKRALRTLASEYLNKIIQNDINGHDSAEDAVTCMELVIWKVKEGMKINSFKK